MQSRAKHDLQTIAMEGNIELAAETELSILGDIFGMLPGGVTVQDQRGRFLPVNDWPHSAR